MSNSDIIELEKDRDFYKEAFRQMYESKVERIDELEAENKRLKEAMQMHCREAMQRIYDNCSETFDLIIDIASDALEGDEQ